jgi:hypothetical protein
MFASQQNYGSNVARNSPFANSLTRAATTGVKSPYTQSGDRTRSAFSRALMDQSKGEIGGQYENARRDLEMQQQKTRLADVQARRGSQLQDFSLDTELDVAGKKLDSRKKQTLADMASQLDRAKKDYKVARLSNMTNLFLSGGLLVTPSAGAMMRAWNAGNPRPPNAGLVGQGYTSYSAFSNPAMFDPGYFPMTNSVFSNQLRAQ